MKKLLYIVLLLFVGVTSCIEPPLKLPAEVVLVDMPSVQVDMNVVWNLDVDWHANWYYGWNDEDQYAWGDTCYPTPTNYEVRRYYLGDKPTVPHTRVDSFTIYGNTFRRTYEFGYYDMLIWSNIDAESQVLLIDESRLDTIHATTTVTRGMTRMTTSSELSDFNVVTSIDTENSLVTGLFNQPEIFYATYPQDVHISRNKEDYDYYDEVEQCWVKKINCTLVPRVYIYLVQIIIKNNQSGRVKSSTGDNALSNMSAGTSVNTGHTWNMPVVAYFQTRMKENMTYEGEQVDIIGGKLTTFGLCDLTPYEEDNSPLYHGSRTDLRNHLYVEVNMGNAKQTLQFDVTDQVQKQSHGGVITLVIDANDIPDPVAPDPVPNSVFVPTVEGYDEIIYDIVM